MRGASYPAPQSPVQVAVPQLRSHSELQGAPPLVRQLGRTMPLPNLETMFGALSNASLGTVEAQSPPPSPKRRRAHSQLAGLTPSEGHGPTSQHWRVQATESRGGVTEAQAQRAKLFEATLANVIGPSISPPRTQVHGRASPPPLLVEESSRGRHHDGTAGTTLAPEALHGTVGSLSSLQWTDNAHSPTPSTDLADVSPSQ